MNVTFNLLLVLAVLAIVLSCAWLLKRKRDRWMRNTCLMANTNIAPSAGRAVDGNKTYLAAAAISRYNLVKIGADATHVAVSAGATDKILGIALDQAESAEDPISVAVLGACKGTQLVIAGAAITLGDWVQSNGDGTVKTLVATGYAVGRALNAASGAGDLVEIAPVGVSTLAAV